MGLGTRQKQIESSHYGAPPQEACRRLAHVVPSCWITTGGVEGHCFVVVKIVKRAP